MVSRTQEHKNRTGQRNMKRRFTEDEIGVLWDGEGEEGSGLSLLTLPRSNRHSVFLRSDQGLAEQCRRRSAQWHGAADHKHRLRLRQRAPNQRH